MADMIPLGPPGGGPPPGRGNWQHRGGRRGGGGRWGRGRGRGRGRGWNGGRGGRGGGGGGGWGWGGRGNPQGRGRQQGRGGRTPRPHDVTFDPIVELGEASPESISIAIEGCCHGELDTIYKRLEEHEKKTGQKVDLLLCCGDFQSFRNPADFHSAAIPPKYRALGTFPKYYAEEKTAPILTIFIGGNHEASQPLRELQYGGWVAPNIYYLGAVGVVKFGGLRIGGISGIYNVGSHRFGHFERPPYDNSTVRSAYHLRNIDAFRMKCLSSCEGASVVDIMLSHDWPQGIEQHGDTQALLRMKPFFRQEVMRNALGSPLNRDILDTVKPKWWFSAHLHVKFHASVKHASAVRDTKTTSNLHLVPSQVPAPSKNSNITQPTTEVESEGKDGSSGVETVEETQTTNKADNGSNETEKADSGSNETKFHAMESSNACSGPDLTDQMTQFLALDKCLPKRRYLSILNIKANSPSSSRVLEYDAEWLAILRKSHSLTCTEKQKVSEPADLIEVTSSDIQWVEEKINQVECQGTIPQNFCQTVPTYADPIFKGQCTSFPLMGNPQTDKLLEILEIDHLITVPYDKQALSGWLATNRKADVKVAPHDDDEINLDGISDEGDDDDADESKAIDEKPSDVKEEMSNESELQNQSLEFDESETPLKKPRVD